MVPSGEELPELQYEEEVELQSDEVKTGYEGVADLTPGIPGVSSPVIDLTGDIGEVYHPLPPNPTSIKLEEEEIVFEDERVTPGVKQEPGALFTRPFKNTPSLNSDKYITRSGRSVKPVSQYVPSLGSAKKYEEHAGVMAKEEDICACEEFKPMETIQYEQNKACLLGELFQQMHINKGLKKFGSRAEDSGKSEMSQIHNRTAVNPVLWDNLSEKEREEVIGSLLLIEEKRTGDLKGRLVARGDEEKKFTPKEEVSSPTVNTSAVFLTAVIEAKEQRDTRVHDVPNAFVQADNEDRVIMKIKGKAAEYLVLCDPRLYRKYAMIEKVSRFFMWSLPRPCMGS